MALGQQGIREVRSNESGSAGQQCSHDVRGLISLLAPAGRVSRQAQNCVCRAIRRPAVGPERVLLREGRAAAYDRLARLPIIQE